jgi:methanobactin biosynthesis MbnP-like protein
MKQFIFCLGLLSVAGFVKKPAGSITIQFRHKVGDRGLQLLNEIYTNPLGEPITITRFKYYISHVSITGAGQKEKELSPETFLIDEAVPGSKTLTFTTDITTPQTLSFVIGVDSALNVSGVQTGSLDPLNGMFWTWNSGYIFAKLEGKSDSSKAPAHSLQYNVGGFRSNNNAIRNVQLTLPQGTTKYVIDADLLKWFSGKHTIKVTQSPLCHQPGALAMKLADNYANMFSIEK